MADQELLETPAPPVSETEAAFDDKAAWGADSEVRQDEGQPTFGDLDTPEPPAEPPAAAASTEPTETEPVRDADGKFTKQPGKSKRDNPYARMKDATAKEAAAKRELEDARAEAARLKTELEAARRPVAAPSPAAPPAPMPAAAPTQPGGTFPTFDSWAAKNPEGTFDDYIRAQAQDVFQRQFESYQAQQRAQQRVSTYQQRLKEGYQRLPGLQAFVEDPQASPALDQALAKRGLQRFPPVIAEAVVDSERAPEILHFFGTHPEEAAQLAWDAKDAPVTAAPWMRRFLEATVTAGAAQGTPDSAPAARPSSAKPPINRVGGTASATPIDPDDLEFGPEYLRVENQRERERQKMGRW